MTDRTTVALDPCLDVRPGDLIRVDGELMRVSSRDQFYSSRWGCAQQVTLEDVDNEPKQTTEIVKP